MTSHRIIFFDVRGGVGTVRSSERGPVLDVYPFVRGIRDALVAAGARLGLIGNACETCCANAEVLRELVDAAGIGGWFAPELLICGATSGRAVFRHAALRAGEVRRWYVSRDPVASARAAAEGFIAVPHTLLASDAVAGDRLHYLKVTGAGAAARVEGVHTAGVVALELIDPATAYAVASDSGAARLVRAGLRLEPIDGLSPVTALYRLHDDRGPGYRSLLASWDELLPEPGAIVAERDDAIYLALAADDAIERHHIPGARHGHARALVADSTLTTGGIEDASAAGAEPSWTHAEQQAVDAISAVAIADDVRALGGHGAAGWLEARLRRLALRVDRHCVAHRGEVVHNLEAELPGTSPELVLVIARRGEEPNGAAAVLAIAHAFVALAGASPAPRRTVRFVVFDADEGSSSYAHDQVMRDATIAGVFQLDLGHPSQRCTIHIGAFPNAGVEARSAALADLLADAIDHRLAPALHLQVCSTRTGDRARLRRDHSQFHLRDYAACSISEDRTGAHAGDLAIVADIARLVAAAAMRAARL